MSETVYIESSILGYLTARSTQNMILAANIQVTLGEVKLGRYEEI